VDTNVPVGFSRKGVVTGNTVSAISGKGSHFGIGNVSDADLRAFANDILASLPADEVIEKPAKAKSAKAAKAQESETVEQTQAS
jgi:hypothetical protein